MVGGGSVGGGSVGGGFVGGGAVGGGSVGGGAVGGLSRSGTSVDVGATVGEGVAVARRLVGEGEGVKVTVAEAAAVALGVNVAVAVSGTRVNVGVAVAGSGVAVFDGTTRGTPPDEESVGVLVGKAIVSVGLSGELGPAIMKAMTTMPSITNKPAPASSILRRFCRRDRSNSSAGKVLVRLGSSTDRERTIRRAARMSLALANRLVMLTSIARRITRSTSGETAGASSLTERNAPGLETRRVTVAGGSPVSK